MILNLPRFYSDENGRFKVDDVPLGENYFLFADIETHDLL